MKKLLKLLDNRLLFYLVALLILFIPLYPKLPAIGVRNTWVYIRAEDFLIAGTSIFFLVQLARKKVSFYKPLGIPIGLYWIAGLFSLTASLIFIAPHLANFFPHVAVLSYLRRIEYMILFFIGFAAVSSQKDIRKLFWVLSIAALAVFIYGIGQRYYINIWALFPQFFEKIPFCFPSFQTTNEEFAKGIPLCLPADGRITSLFGGHYDLSAYLVLVIPIILTVSFAVKNLFKKVFLWLLGIGLVYLLILTASRISFAAYVIGIIFAFAFIKRKIFLIPLLIISMYFLMTSSSSVLQRFTQTFRFTNLILNSSGQLIGEAANQLPEDLRDKISKNSLILGKPPPTQQLPTGSSYIAFPGGKSATSSAFLTSNPKLSKAEKSKYQFGAVEITSVQGNFLIQRALVYDISFTTRFQGEWPNSWGAFMRNPLLGSGYATITLSTDNSFLRALGEVGLVGFVTFFSFFLVWYIFVKNSKSNAPVFERYFALGVSAGVIGIFINALLIDVFEASKLAESMWLLLGISAGALILSFEKEKINYIKEVIKVLTSHLFLMIYLLIMFLFYLAPSFDNYFVGDDFSWFRWAAASDDRSLLRNFFDAGGFFFRPIDKLLIFIQYTLFSLKPLPQHLINLFYNFGVSVAVYILLLNIFKKKKIAFLGAFIFSFIPSHSQNLYWIATISTTVSSLFILFGLALYYLARMHKNWLLYIFSLLFFLLSVFSYENAVIFVGLMALFDLFIVDRRRLENRLVIFIPYIISGAIIGFYLWLRSYSHAAGFSGDYNYNLVKLIPNSIGNYMGYVAMFFVSENSLNAYNLLRNSLKAYALIIGFIGFMMIAFIGGFLIEHKEKIYLSDKKKLFIFGFLFSAVSLLPYLPLGNITLRYLYLASFGFIVMILVVVEHLLAKIKNKSYNMAAFGILGAILAIAFYFGLSYAESYWDRASRITYDTLVRFRLDYDIKNHTNLYFYNVPTKIGEAYIFPVGLPDAIYFVNTDPSVKVFQVKDRLEAEKLKKAAPKDVLYKGIFTFDRDMFMKKISYPKQQ